MNSRDIKRSILSPGPLMIERLEPRRMLSAQLLKDINATPIDPYGGPPTSPGTPFAFGSIALFAQANDEFENVELWRTDGTAAGTSLVKDINPGPLPSFPSGFVSFAGYAYFTAETGSSQSLVGGLWRTDGTSTGTTQIQNLNPTGGAGTFTPTLISGMTVAGSKMYFFTNDATASGRDLWVTDGTSAGTTLVSDIALASGQYVETATTDGSRLFFQVYNFFQNTGTVWVSDGTSAGTQSLATVPGFQSPIYAMGSTAYFVDETGALWQTQGTSQTTFSLGTAGPSTSTESTTAASLLAVGGSLYIADGSLYCYTPGAGVPVPLTYGSSSIVGASQLVGVNGSAYLVANANTQGPVQFPFYDVFQASPSGVTPMIAPSSGTTFTNLTAVGSSLFFLENSGEIGSIPATVGGAVSLVNVSTTGAPQPPQGFAAFGSMLLFDNWDPVHGWDVWSSDGTSANTGMIVDANPSTLPSNPSNEFNFGNRILFSADDGVHGQELWITDGTTAGTSLLADINPGASGSSPNGFTLLGNRVFFVVTVGTGTQLWVTDGTAAGTQPLSTTSFVRMGALTVFGNSIYFSAEDNSVSELHGLWKSDGTAAGTYEVSSFGVTNTTTYVGPVGVAGGSLIVMVGNALYASDGTAGGSSLILSNGSWLGSFQTIGNDVYFSASDSTHGRELWRTDGTVNGTALFSDINPGPADSLPAYYSDEDPNYQLYNGSIYLEATVAGYGAELVAVDAKGNATVVKDLIPGPGGSTPINMRVFNGKLYFLAKDVDTGSPFTDEIDQLWVTDGTANGTSLVFQGNPTSQSSNLDVVGNSLYFYSTTQPDANAVLYSSDGTTAGTAPVWQNAPQVNEQFLPGPIVGFPDGRLMVAADDGVHGFEPWIFSQAAMPSANGGGPYTVSEGSSVVLNASGSSDVGGTITAYEWDFTDGGSFVQTDATGAKPTFSAANLDGPSQIVVALRITDSSGATSVSEATINVTDVAPTATFVGSTVTLGNAGTVTFSNQHDPSIADTNAGFTYSYDFNDDGTYDLVTTSPTATVPASYLASVGGHTVTAEITDKDGGSTTYTATVQVNAATEDPKLTGSVIGTAGSYKNSGNSAAKAFDGSLVTYFDGPSANGNWVGLDLGSAKIITSLAYASRNGWASRMNGGIFQASNSSTFASGVVNLYTIPANQNPTWTALTTQTVSNPNGYRYVRYLAPANSYGDVSEVQFFGKPFAGLTQFVGTTIGTSGSYKNDGNTIAKATDGNLSTFFDGASANGNWVGLDLGSARVIKQISYEPRSGWANRMVGGIIQASNSANFSSGVVNVYTITTAPPQNVLTSVSISLSTAYRYVRYLSPAGSYGDIGEFQVFG